MALLAVAGAAALARPAQAQTQATLLRGSKASVERMYQQALDHDLTFFETPSAVREAARKGRIDSLVPNGDFTLHAVSFPYLISSTRVFVERLAGQYRSACREPMVVTSAVRPESRQPRNSSANSVHPTGMAVDLRRPSGRCLTWLRSTLTDLEKAGVLEVTEERNPVHFHVAVFPQPYASYLSGARTALVASSEEAAGAAEAGGANAGATSTSATSAGAATVAASAVKPPARKAAAAPPRARATTSYRVRSGDTLWHLARRYGTTVNGLRSLNGLSGSRIRPGQTLLVPAGR